MSRIVRDKFKTFADTYIYQQTDVYEKKLLEYIMEAERIDKNSSGFENIKSRVKTRQVTSILYKILENDNVVLMHSFKPLPKAFRVTAMKDLKAGSGDNHIKVFIDCSSIMTNTGGIWSTTDIDVFLSYLASAVVYYVYFRDRNKMIYNTELSRKGAGAFSILFTNIIDYLYKISQIDLNREKCIYMSIMYYMTNILGRGFTDDSVKSLAKRLSRLSDNQINSILLEFHEDDCINIKTFVDAVKNSLKIEGLTIDAFIEKWIFLYGTGTMFALEYLPAFSTMMTDTYVGAYINNQRTIENIVGKDMVDFSKALFRIGEGVI